MADNQIKAWLEITARIGYVAKGILYIIMGALSAQVALGTGGQTAGMKEALYEVASKPYGKVMLGIVALGLIAHVLWRFAQAFVDPEGKGAKVKAIFQRIGFASAVPMYGAMAYLSFKIILGSGSSSSPQSLTASVLSKPFGPYLVGAVGASIIISGFFQLYLAISAGFEHKFKMSSMNKTEKAISVNISRYGLGARSVVFGMIGYFLIVSAINFNPDKASGIGGALRRLLQEPYGPYLMLVVAVGLIAYGGFDIVLSVYRKFPVRG